MKQHQSRVKVIAFVAFYIVFLFLGYHFSFAFLYAYFGIECLFWLYKKIEQKKQHAEIEQYLPQGLSVLASSLRAGLSLPEALNQLVQSAPPSFARAIGDGLKKHYLGRPMAEALQEIGSTYCLPSLRTAMGALVMAHELGGPLPRILDRMSYSLRERQRVDGRLRALTAQGRMQAWLLCLAPPAIFVFIYFFDPHKYQLLTQTTLGQFMLIMAITLETMGLLTCRRIMRFEV